MVLVRRIGSQESQKYELSEGARIIDLLEKTEFNTETVVVRQNGKIVPEEEQLEDGDELELIPVVSGG
ncbi:hypothetical protein AKJ48_03195 [candidate division MSBL1 archaeon SCGC-AAA261O19]|uniref:Thiamine biosynthesis protein ThiS n=1 Tax=candidate division MSBL1 archaeon SCGC-AAA261O19 TaxID=1698277 RepID=A0A133VCY1_9EURY|nr:hypothetical protein AKJ48_03195 [candidate division MSBL1 archaeon SCGC-AAA261O19]